MKIQVKSEDYAETVEDRADMIDMFGLEVEPVDLYGKRVNLNKSDPTNLEKTAEDIKSFYGLDD